jgi:hypothetical protein
MGNDKFKHHADQFAVIAVMVPLIAVEQSLHIHLGGQPLLPGNGYGVQAIVTNTSTSTSSR